MDIGEHLMKSLEFQDVIPLPFLGGEEIKLFGVTVKTAISETVIVSWVVMAILVAAALLLCRRLKQVPEGAQNLLEMAVGFLNKFSREQFGKRAGVYGPFIGTVFLFLLTANIIPVLSPVAVSLFNAEPPFSVKPPTRDINLTAALSLLSIFVVLFSGLRAKGFRGWVKHLFHPLPMMLPFNLLEYIIRPLSLCLRLFGNILGGFIIMLLVEIALPVPVLVPTALSLYFDFFDGLIQALVFTFLTALFIAEAVHDEKSEHEGPAERDFSNKKA